MMQARSRLAVLAVILGLSAALAPAAHAQERVIRWGSNGEISTMDPHGAFSTANASLLGNIYESLVRQDRNLRMEPALATSWEVIAPDHWRFFMRQGVRFHDGSPLTAGDVVQSLRRASLPSSPYLSATHMIKEVAEVDPFTVDVFLRGPYPILLNDLAGVGILSAAWMRAHDAFEPADPVKGRTAFTSLNTNGTGPFRLVSREPGVETVLERFPGWWDKPADRVDRVVFRPIPNDATRVAALLSGQVDLISPAPLQDVDRIRQSPGTKLVEGQDLRVVYIGYNVSPERAQGRADGTPLADVRVRKALSAAIDIEAITRRVMRALTQPIATLIAPEIQGYEPAQAVRRVTFDPDYAKALLAEAGYPGGFKLGMDCAGDRFVNADRVCQAIQGMWARIGVQADLATMPYPAFMQKSLKGESDSFLMGWANTPQIDAASILTNVIHTRSERLGTWNAQRFSNAALDALIERLGTEMDTARRQKLFTEAFALEAEQFVTMPLYREPMLLGMRRNLDVPASADGKMRFYLAHIE
jgi:peptide/nickel transport system substrate-binding protein